MSRDLENILKKAENISIDSITNNNRRILKDSGNIYKAIGGFYNQKKNNRKTVIKKQSTKNMLIKNKKKKTLKKKRTYRKRNIKKTIKMKKK
jgi:hypothetical protein